MNGSIALFTSQAQWSAGFVALCVAFCLSTAPANAQSRGLDDLGAGQAAEERASVGVPVDVELVLAVDISWSMSDADQIIQRNGYAAAFRSREVQDAITDGIHGAIAVTYVEWAGEASQATIVPWALINSKATADAFAYRLQTQPPSRLRRTSISAGIRYGASLFDDNGYAGLKQVIDISGDGPNNQGPFVTDERDKAVASGIVINGLPLMTVDRTASFTAIDNLDEYYEDCVVGGKGSFVIPVHDWPQFPQAVRQKLVLELASDWSIDDRDPLMGDGDRPVVPVQSRPKVDCLIGETLWQQRLRWWPDDMQ